MALSARLPISIPLKVTAFTRNSNQSPRNQHENLISLLYFEDTTLDGKKLHKTKNWIEQIRHNIKLPYYFDMNPGFTEEH